MCQNTHGKPHVFLVISTHWNLAVCQLRNPDKPKSWPSSTTFHQAFLVRLYSTQERTKIPCKIPSKSIAESDVGIPRMASPSYWGCNLQQIPEGKPTCSGFFWGFLHCPVDVSHTFAQSTPQHIQWVLQSQTGGIDQNCRVTWENDDTSWYIMGFWDVIHIFRQPKMWNSYLESGKKIVRDDLSRSKFKLWNTTNAGTTTTLTMGFTPVTLVQAEESGCAKAPSWWCPRAVQWSKKSNSVLLRSCVPWAGSISIDPCTKPSCPSTRKMAP